MTKNKLLLFLIFFISTPYSFINASECYHYHTKEYNQVKAENGKTYWTRTVKDPNDTSIVSYSKTLLQGINTENLRIISENNEGLIFANSEFYYWLDTAPYKSKERVIEKLIETKKVSRVFGKNTFLIDGKWTHFDYNKYTKKLTTIIIPNFPENPILVKKFDGHRRNCYLIKDENSVFGYSEDEKKITKIPELNAKSTRFFETDWAYGEHFLYDDDTFYRIDMNFESPRNITKQFVLLELKHKFTNAKIIRVNNSFFLDFNDGTIWAYVGAGIGLKDLGSVNFYPVENAKYHPEIDLVSYKNNYYNDSWGLVHEQRKIDISAIKNMQNLKIYKDIWYKDDFNIYKLAYNKNENLAFLPFDQNISEIDFEKITGKHNQALFSHKHSLSAFFCDEKYIFYWNQNEDKFKKLTRYSSPIKDLKLAFSFDDKILIEDQQISHTMDSETIEFLGSTVDVISPCDGGGNGNSVEVEYNYFFKDKNAVYQYHSKEKELKKLTISNPKDFNEDNFIDKITLLQKDFKIEVDW